MNQLIGRRNALQTSGEAYTMHDSELKVLDSTVVGNTLVMQVEEDSTLYYAKIHGDEPEFTAWVAEREFTFVRGEAGWELVGQQLVGNGVSPVNEPNDVTEEQALEAINAQAAQSPGEMAAEREALAVPSSEVGVTGSFNRSAAASYAVRYYRNYNPSYRTFNDVGGDCTNFVSQAMRAGGWTDDSGWYKGAENWWYNSLNQTWSWTSVAYWYQFAAVHSRRTSVMSSPRSLVSGEVLQADFTNNGSKDHTMIVTSRSSGGEIYLTYHTTNTLNRSFASLASASPKARWLPHFVKTTF